MCNYMKKLAFIGLFVLLSGPALAQGSYNGRFEIIETEYSIYLLDSTTGRTWEITRTVQGDKYVDSWRPIARFDKLTVDGGSITFDNSGRPTGVDNPPADE